MSLTRRSRHRRTPTGKNLALTARDIEIFRALSGYRYLRSSYLHAFVGGASERRFKERLGDLFHEGFIDRPAKQWEFADARHLPAVYEIGKRADLLLAENASGETGERTFLSATAHRQFTHAVTICECLASIELATCERPDLRFIPWSEILVRAPECTRTSPVPFRMPLSDAGTVIPDGLFGLEYRSEARQSYRFFALEIDRGTMPVMRANSEQTSYFRKLASYREIIASEAPKRHWGVPNLLALTLTTSERHMTTMMQSLDDSRQLNAPLLFKWVDSSSKALAKPMHDLLLAPWQRVGHDALSICTP